MKRTFESICGMSRRRYEIEVEGPLYKYVNNTRPAGVYAMSNYGGVAIFEISGDECIAAYHFGNGYTGAHRHCIYYSESGREYIKKGGCRYYLDEFMRVA